MDEPPNSIPPEVLARIEATLQGLLATPGIVDFAIRVSHAPKQAAQGLGADAIVSLFRSDSPDEAEGLARWLLTRLGPRAAAPGVPPFLGPRIPGEWTHVYVALWADPDLPPP